MLIKVEKRAMRWTARIIGLFFCSWLILELFIPSRTIYYRLDVTFEVDGVPVTGSGVQKFTIVRNRVPLSFGEFSSRTYGEAVIVDLPSGKSVFALLAIPGRDGAFKGGNGGINFLFLNACKLYEKNERQGPASLIRMAGRVSGSCEIPPQDMPLMVTFEDEKNSTSVRRVFPDHPETTLGKNVKFVGASLTTTNGPMTTGILHRLPWLSDNSGNRLTPGFVGSFQPSLPDLLEKMYFRRI